MLAKRNVRQIKSPPLTSELLSTANELSSADEPAADWETEPVPVIPIMIAVWFAGVLTGLMLHYGYVFLRHWIAGF
jgi:hypothetical protein